MNSFNESVPDMFSDEPIIDLSSQNQEVLVNGLETCNYSLPGEADDVVEFLEALCGLDTLVELLKFF